MLLSRFCLSHWDLAKNRWDLAKNHWDLAKNGGASKLPAVFSRRAAGFAPKHLCKMTWAGITHV